MMKAHRIRLHPTAEQENYLARAAGTARFVWNWALDEWQKQYEAWKADQEKPKAERKVEKPTALRLKKQFNALRREHFPWTWEVTKNACDQPFFDLGKAFTAFFEHRANYPQFKSKKKSKASFYLANDQFEVGDHRLWIPKLGWVNMAEKLRFVGKITGARITKTADWWFVSITVEVRDPSFLPADRPAVGIDVGLNHLATLSTGEVFENQRYLKTAQRKLRQANKRLHRRKLGSKNREKARHQVARLHYRIRSLRDDVLHKLTTQVANTYALVGMEDLNLKGLFKNHCLAQAFADAALGRLMSWLTEKVAVRGGRVIKVGRFFPSSQLCSCCRWRWQDITLADRTFVCQHCGVVQDRDVNAARNILQEALRLLVEIQQTEAAFGIGSDKAEKMPVDLG